MPVHAYAATPYTPLAKPVSATASTGKQEPDPYSYINRHIGGDRSRNLSQNGNPATDIPVMESPTDSVSHISASPSRNMFAAASWDNHVCSTDNLALTRKDICLQRAICERASYRKDLPYKARSANCLESGIIKPLSENSV